MSNDIARLTLEIDSIKARLAKEELARLSEQGTKTSSTAALLKKEFESFDKTLQAITPHIRLAAAAAAGATTTFAFSVIRSAAALDDLSEITGASVERLSALQRVAKVSGQEFTQVTFSMTQFQRALSGVEDDSDSVGAALTSIGLSVKEMKGLRADEQMLKIAQALAKYSDEGGKAAVIQTLYKKGAQEMLPFLKDLAETGELNATVTSDQAAAAERLEKAVRRATTEFLALKAVPILEFMQALEEEMGKNEVGLKNLDGGFDPFRETLRAIVVLGANVVYVFKQTGIEIGALFAKLEQAGKIAKYGPFAPFMKEGQEAFRMFKEIGRIAKEDAEQARRDFDALEQRLLNVGKAGAPSAPRESRPKINYEGAEKSDKRTEAEKRFQSILEQTDVARKAQLESDIQAINAWAEADDKRTLQAVQAINILLDAYDRESGAFDAREEARKKSEKSLEDSEKARLEFLERQSAVELDAATQMEENIKLEVKRREQIEEFKKSNEGRINQLRLEAAEVNRTARERAMAAEAMRLEGEYQRAKVGLTETEIKVLDRLYEKQKQSLAIVVDQKLTTEKLIEDQKKQAEQAKKIWDNFIQNVQSTLGDQLYQVMQGSFDNIGKAFYQMIQRMLADALAANLMKQIFGETSGTGGMGGAIASIFGAWAGSSVAIANGAAFDGDVSMFANGGIVSSTTPFRFGSGGSKKGIMGEAGPEAIIPLKRDASGQLGVAGGGSTINYAPVINIDSRTDRAEVQRLTQNAIQKGNAELVDKLTRAGVI